MRTSGQARIDAQNPWPGLEAFDEGAERFFNGRTEETAELRRLVMQAPLTVVFGMSGLGKTSLLQAGLFPAIRKENVLPVYVRLDVRSRDGTLIDQVARALQLEMARHQVDAPPLAEGEALWDYLHRAGLELWSAHNQLLTPLFVLDQFEEVFTLGADRQQAVAQLRRDLSDLVENRVPAPLAELIRGADAAGARYVLDGQRYKVLLSFREDFLPPVEGWKQEMPSILRNRLRLLPMSAGRAFEAVHDTAPHLVNEALAHRIVDFVAAAQDRGSAGASLGGPAELNVEPALLSLVCHGLNEKRKERGQAEFDDALLRETGPSVISDFYARSVSGLSEATQRFIEEQLITESGFRKQCAVEDARSRHGVADAELSLLVDRRLLRIEPSRGTEHVELVHDLLTGVVREVRERERQRARQRVQRRRRMRRLAIAVVGVGLVTTGFVIRERQEHQRMAREETERADSIRMITVGRYNEDLRALNDDLARGKAEAELLRARAQLSAIRAQVALQELDTILSKRTGAQLARAALDEFETASRPRQERQRSAPADSALADSVNKDLATFRTLRRISDVATRAAMRADAVAAAYVARGRFIPFDSYSRADLFDTRQLARVIGSDSLLLARALLGDSLPENPEREQQPAFFRTGRRPGDRQWIEWEAPAAQAVGSVALFAAHDGRNDSVPSGNAPRSFRRLTLTTRDRNAVIDTLVDYLPALPYAGPEAFGDAQPLRSLSVCFPTRTNPPRRNDASPGRTRFRLETVQASYTGARLIEVDAYADASCGAPTPAVLAGLGESVSAAELSRRYGSSTVTVAMVLAQMEGDTTGRRFAGGVEFLARTTRAAWNQALVSRTANLLRRRRSGGQWGDSLARTLAAIVPDWRKRAALSVARDSGRRLLLDDAFSDAQVRDSLDALAAQAGVAVDADDSLRTWRADVARLDSMRRASQRLSENRNALLSERGNALSTYLRARDTSSRLGHGADGPAVRRLLGALRERVFGSWAVCSSTREGRCPGVRRQTEFVVGDSLHASLAPAPGSLDSSVTVVVLSDSVQEARESMLVPSMPTPDLKRPELAAPAPWGGFVLRSPGRWTLRIYDSLDRLVFRHEFTVRPAASSP